MFGYLKALRMPAPRNILSFSPVVTQTCFMCVSAEPLGQRSTPQRGVKRPREGFYGRKRV